MTTFNTSCEIEASVEDVFAAVSDEVRLERLREQPQEAARLLRVALEDVATHPAMPAAGGARCNRGTR